MSRTNYIRILVLSSIDILLTLPIGIVTLVLDIKDLSHQDLPLFYPGWTYDHSDWEPESYTYAELQAYGTSTTVPFQFSQWTSPVLAFVIFGLFGATARARASYWHVICHVGGVFGWIPKASLEEDSVIQFGERPQDNSCDTETRCVLEFLGFQISGLKAQVNLKLTCGLGLELIPPTVTCKHPRKARRRFAALLGFQEIVPTRRKQVEPREYRCEWAGIRSAQRGRRRSCQLTAL